MRKGDEQGARVTGLRAACCLPAVCRVRGVTRAPSLPPPSLAYLHPTLERRTRVEWAARRTAAASEVLGASHLPSARGLVRRGDLHGAPQLGRSPRSLIMTACYYGAADGSLLAPGFTCLVTCLARGRSATGASSSPHASLQASSARSSACGHSPRSTRATAAAPARRTAPALSKPPSPSSGRPSRSASPSLPAQGQGWGSGAGQGEGHHWCRGYG